MKESKGIILVLVGAICFSIKAILIKLAYGSQSVDPLVLLTLRMSFSLPFFIAVLYFKKPENPPSDITTTDWFKLIILGILGYYVASLFDFMGLKYVTAGLERLILFIYPTLVVIINYFVYKKRISKSVFAALICTYIGISIIFSDPHMTTQDNIWLGSWFIFISALTYAGYLVGSGELIPKMGSIVYNSYAMIVSCVAVIVHFFLIVNPIKLQDIPNSLFVYGLIIAIVCTVIPTFLVSEGIRLIGASKASIIASIGPVATLVLGYFFLGETISLKEVAGTFFVIGGVVWISLKK